MPEKTDSTKTSSPQEKHVEDKPWYCINTHLISSKAAYFFEYAKEGSHFPYLILFYVSVGLDPTQAGFIGGIRFIGGLLGAPICGWIADKTGRHKTIAILACILAATINMMQPIVTVAMGDHGKRNTCPNISVELDVLTSNATNNATLAPLNGTMTSSVMNSGNMFYTLLVVSTIASFFDGSTMGFVDSGVLHNMLASPTPASIGGQRYFGPLGVGVAAFVSGVFVDYFPSIHVSCYMGIFVNYILVCGGMAVTFYYLLPSTQHRHDVDPKINRILWATLRESNTWFFLGIVFFNGIALALAFSFSFLFLEEMQVSNVVLGLSMCINGVSGAGFYVISDRIVNFLGGNLNSMAFSSLCWTLRYMGLAFLNRPYQFLLLCTINGLTCSLFVTAYVSYIREKFSPKIFTVVCGIAASLYNSGGYVVANIVGGVGYQYLGAQDLFMICSVACFCCTLLTFVYSIFLKYSNILETKNSTNGSNLPIV